MSHYRQTVTRISRESTYERTFVLMWHARDFQTWRPKINQQKVEGEKGVGWGGGRKVFNPENNLKFRCDDWRVKDRGGNWWILIEKKKNKNHVGVKKDSTSRQNLYS